MQIYSKIKIWFDQVFLTSTENDFIRLTRNLSPKDRQEPKMKILLQMPDDHFYVILFSSLIRSLRLNFFVEPSWISLTNVYEPGFKGWLKKTRFYNRRWRKLFLANGGEVVYDHAFYENKIPSEVRSLGEKIFLGLRSKDDVMAVAFDGVVLGDLIYDSYLRFKPAATIDLADPFLKTLILSALDQAVRQSKLFLQKQFDYLFTSYSSYIHHGVMVRSALKYGVKVISFGNYDQLAKAVDSSHPSHFKAFYQYQALFEEIDPSVRPQLVLEGKKHLETRFSGGVDNSTYYMAKSAYHQNNSVQKVFSENGRKRIVLFLHDFYDSPHIHRSMLYPDFYDWVFETLKILTETGHDVFIKPHPNSVQGNQPVLQEIKDAFPEAHFISKEVSNRQLIHEGFDLGLTVYGTLAHEFPYFGIPVLNAGDNPHINYDFCTHPRTRKEYEDFLKNIETVPKPDQSARDRIHEFYYMHNFYLIPGKLPIDENNYVNSEIRHFPRPERFSEFLIKYENKDYRDHLDALLLKSLQSIIQA